MGDLEQRANAKFELDKKDYVTQWITQSEFDDTSSEISSVVASTDEVGSVLASSIVDSEDYTESLKNLKIGPNSPPAGGTIITNNQDTNVLNKVDVLQHVFNTNNNVQTLGNIQIEKSKKIHVGNVTYITGPIYITNTSGGSIGNLNQSNQNINKANNKGDVEQNIVMESEDDEESKTNHDLFIGQIKRSIASNVLNIVDRRTWLAMRPLEPYEYVSGPVKYVIISHTATEMTTTQAESVYLVRHIQGFHVESRKWIDIGYNFLIGGDGIVYEGRNWGVVGAHAKGYNKVSVGISFVGCFMKELPPKISLDACKLLIEKGIELGHIDPDYKLLAHCQCSPTESPGRRLFEELQTWEHFTEAP